MEQEEKANLRMQLILARMAALDQKVMACALSKTGRAPGRKKYRSDATRTARAADPKANYGKASK